MRTCTCEHAEDKHESVTPGLKAGADVKIKWGELQFDGKVVGGCMTEGCECQAFVARPVPPWIQIMRMAEHARRTGTRVFVAAPGDERNVWGSSVAMPLGYRIDQPLEDNEEFSLCEMLSVRLADHATAMLRGRPRSSIAPRDSEHPCVECGAAVEQPCTPIHDGERDADGTWSHPMRVRAKEIPTAVRKLVEWAHAKERSREVIDFGGLSIQDVGDAVRRLCDVIPAYSSKTVRTPPGRFRVRFTGPRPTVGDPVAIDDSGCVRLPHVGDVIFAYRVMTSESMGTLGIDQIEVVVPDHGPYW